MKSFFVFLANFKYDNSLYPVAFFWGFQDRSPTVVGKNIPIKNENNDP